MKPILRYCLIITLLLIIFWTGQVLAQTINRFNGLYEPSGAVKLVDNHVLIIVDEKESPVHLFSVTTGSDNHPQLSPRFHSGASIKAADLEAMARGNKNDIFLITSHSYSHKGKRRKERQQFLKLSVEQDNITAVAVYENLLPHLQKHLSNTLQMDTETVDEINIEGMAFDPEQQVLLIGLRAPAADGKAILLTLRNPYELFDHGAEPAFGSAPILLDLKGATIRSIVFDDKRSRFLIAGEGKNKKGKLRSRLWQWQQSKTRPPEQLALPKLKGIKNIEGMSIVPIAGQDHLLIVCDDGSEGDKSGAHYGFIPLNTLTLEN